MVLNMIVSFFKYKPQNTRETDKDAALSWNQGTN